MSETLRMINALSDAEVLHRKHMKQLRANHQSEITRLTKANAELREALDKIAFQPLAGGDAESGLNECFEDAVRIARKALANNSEGE